MAKLEETISKSIFVYIVAGMFFSIISAIIFLFFIFQKYEISKEEVFSIQFLKLIPVSLISIIIMVMLIYIVFKRQKFTSLTEKEKKGAIGKRIKTKITILAWLMLIPVLFLLYYVGAFNLDILISIIVVTIVLLGIGYGIRYLIKKYEKPTKKKRFLKYFITIIILIIIIFLAPLTAKILVHLLGFQLFYDPADITECFSPMRTEGMRMWCIERHIKDITDVSICDSIEKTQIERGLDTNIFNFVSKDECISSIAKRLDNISLCYEISKEGYREPCISEFAVKTLNMSLCNELHDQPTMRKSHCITSIAKKLKDSKICNMIESDFPRQKCISDISKSQI